MKSSPRLAALKQAVEQCLKFMPESEVLAITKAEVAGAARLREAIQDCQAADRSVQLSYYEKVIDKQVKDEDILSAVEHAVGGNQ